MKIEEKTREQLLAENETLRAKFSELHKAESECRWVEAALRESEERYKRLLESITDYIYTVKVENGRPISTIHGPGCLAVTGYTSEHYQMYPNLWYQMIHEEDRKAVLDQAEKLLKGEAVKPLEHRITHKDGSTRWVRNTPVPHYDKDGNLVSYDGIIENITERKKAEEALKASREYARSIIESSMDMIIAVDKDRRITEFNKAAQETFGYALEEVLGRHIDILYTDPSEGLRVHDVTMANGRHLQEIVNRRKNGELFPSLLSSSVLRNARGDIVGLMGVSHDFTRRKRDEEALKESLTKIERAKQDWEATFDAIADPIFIHDDEFRITRTNRAYAEAAGLQFDEIIGRLYFEVFPRMEGPFTVCKETLISLKMEEEEISVSAINKIFRVRYYPVKDVNGNYLHSIHIMEDITEQRRAEEKIKKLSQSVEQSPSIAIITDEKGNIEYANPKFTEITGYTSEEIIGTNAGDLGMQSPEEYRQMWDTIAAGREWRGTFYNRKKSGEYFWESASISAVRDREGVITNFIKVAEDITERKRAEERLRQEMEVTSHLLMISEATSGMTDIDKLMEQVVHCGHKITGCDICLSYLWDSETGVLSPGQEFGLSHSLIPLFRTESLDMKTGFVKEAMKKREPVIKEVGAVHELPLQWIGGIGTIALIPLIGRKGPLGLIVGIYQVGAGLKPAPTIDEREMKVMKGISHQVSIALEEARLFKESIDKAMELSHQIETIQTMHEIDRSILSTLEPQEILETAARMVARLMPCDRVTVALVDREKKGFVYAVGFGITAVPKGGLVPFEDTSATEVAETHRAQFVSNLSETKGLRPLEEKLLNEGFLSHIRVPLTIKDEVVGVLNVGAKRPSAFSPEDLLTLEKMAAQTGVALSNAKLISDMEELFLGTVKSLSTAIDAKSPWTAGHSERVTKYALDIAKEMGFDRDEMRSLELAGLLHDIGKIGTYDFLLDKPGKLEPDEIEMVRMHPVKGAAILESIKKFRDIIPAIRHHHEHFNGNGYPDKLKGEDIPFLARILAVADTYDAMKADRPYRPGRSMEFILEEFRRCSGTQFDPKVVEAFLKVIEEKEEFKTAAS